jgi:hypothetical protein
LIGNILEGENSYDHDRQHMTRQKLTSILLMDKLTCPNLRMSDKKISGHRKEGYKELPGLCAEH